MSPVQIWFWANLYTIIRRYGQVVRQWIANPRSPVQIWVPPNKLWGRGEMVDTTDLKSVGFAAVRVQVPPPPLSLLVFHLKTLCSLALTK